MTPIVCASWAPRLLGARGRGSLTAPAATPPGVEGARPLDNALGLVWSWIRTWHITGRVTRKSRAGFSGEASCLRPDTRARGCGRSPVDVALLVCSRCHCAVCRTRRSTAATTCATSSTDAATSSPRHLVASSTPRRAARPAMVSGLARQPSPRSASCSIAPELTTSLRALGDSVVRAVRIDFYRDLQEESKEGRHATYGRLCSMILGRTTPARAMG
jgi:hypothetical protein